MLLYWNHESHTIAVASQSRYVETCMLLGKGEQVAKRGISIVLIEVISVEA